MDSFMPIFRNSEVRNGLSKHWNSWFHFRSFLAFAVLHSILHSLQWFSKGRHFGQGVKPKKAGIRTSDVSPYFWLFRIYWMSMWPMVTSTFLTGNCMMISIGIVTWRFHVFWCKSWASRRFGEVYNSDFWLRWHLWLSPWAFYFSTTSGCSAQTVGLKLNVPKVFIPWMAEDLDMAMHIYIL